MQYDDTDKERLKAIRSELAMLQARRFLRTLAVIQDIADALLTLPDLGGQQTLVLLQDIYPIFAVQELIPGSQFQYWWDDLSTPGSTMYPYGDLIV